jgi:hypothetical protein
VIFHLSQTITSTYFNFFAFPKIGKVRDVTTSSYPSTLVTPQGKPTSDHVPCVITIQTQIPGSKVFKFENYWIAHLGFLQTVCASWTKPTFKHNSAANINAKFERLRYDLKYWSRSISRLKICIENTNKAIMEIDKLEDIRRLSAPESNVKKILKSHLARLLEYQNIYWKKRCTIRWTKFGDENTKFFHSVATERYRRNNIASLLAADGTVISEYKGKEEIIF